MYHDMQDIYVVHDEHSTHQTLGYWYKQALTEEMEIFGPLTKFLMVVSKNI